MIHSSSTIRPGFGWGRMNTGERDGLSQEQEEQQQQQLLPQPQPQPQPRPQLQAHSSHQHSPTGAVRALSLEYKGLQLEPVEGFIVSLVQENNLFEWNVAIFGPPDTVYHGGYFKAVMKFPNDYPYSPPAIRFKTKVWHPNIYENGDLCISILHPPVDDPQSGELPCERWNPTQTVRTILLSVISLLNEPNTSSPANVDASVMYRRWKDSLGADKEYEDIVRRQVAASRDEAEKDGVVVPMTVEDYCVPSGRSRSDPGAASHSSDMADLLSEDFDEDDASGDDTETEACSLHSKQ